MARPKLKLREGSTQCFTFARDRFSGDSETQIAADADRASVDFAMFIAAKRFLRGNGKTIECIKQRLLGAITRHPDLMLDLLLLSFFDIIARPEAALLPDKHTPKRLCAFLAEFPDFTLEYLWTLRRAYVKHCRKQTAFQRTVIAIRRREPIQRSDNGKLVKFEDAEDKEIAAHLKVSTSMYKEAKRYIARVDGILQSKSKALSKK